MQLLDEGKGSVAETNSEGGTATEGGRRGGLPVVCCACGFEFGAARSMMMTQFGMNEGHGSCPECNEFLHLEVTPDLTGSRMISVRWNDYLKTQGIVPGEDADDSGSEIPHDTESGGEGQ